MKTKNVAILLLCVSAFSINSYAATKQDKKLTKLELIAYSNLSRLKSACTTDDYVVAGYNDTSLEIAFNMVYNNVNIVIIDENQNIVYQSTVNAGPNSTYTIDISSLPEGIYQLNISNDANLNVGGSFFL